MTTFPSDAYGAFYSRVGLKLAWTTTNTGPGAKVCRESGSGSWKQARPLSPEPGAAAGFFTKKLATRNPVIPAVANRLVLFDFDGAPLDELAARYGLRLPPGAWRVRTARGEHAYASAPPGHPGLKVEVTPARVTVITDGYTMAAPGRHPSGLEYELENVDVTHGSARPPAVDEALIERLRELAGGGRQRVAEVIDSGEPIDAGDRHATLMHHAARLRGEGLGAKAIRAALEELQERFMEPTGRPGEINAVVRWVMGKPAPPPVDHDDVELLQLLDELPGAPPEATTKKAAPRARAIERRPLRLVTAKPIEWLIDEKVPVGTLTLVSGVGGLGKSGLLLAWARDVTLAGRDVLIVSYEDAAEQVLRPRAEALGADLDRIHELYVDTLAGSVSFPTDLPELDRHVLETDAALVLIDPVSASIDLKLDAHRDQDVRVVLGQLARLAERERLAVLQNAHLNKAPSSDPYLRINGSTAFYNASRSVLTVTRDPADPDDYRLVTHHKSNYGPLAPVERWRITPTTILGEGGPMEVMTMEFVEVADDVVREDVLAPRGQDKQTLAAALIFETLAHGRRLSAEVKAAGAREGISERTMKRAAAELELVVEEESTATGRVTYWNLPGGVGPTPTSETWPDPPEPHGQADPEGSGQTRGEGPGPTLLSCDQHSGLHVVDKRAAGFVYLACGCRLPEEDL